MDFIPWLKCQSPDHPPSHDRKSMTCIREDRDFLVFGCHWCMEVRHLESIQVRTNPRFKAEVRRQLAKEGRLMTSAPPIIRKFAMDSTLRDKVFKRG